MKWLKKHWIGLTVGIVGISLLSTSLAVLFWPQGAKASDIYMIQFNEDSADADAKNEYVNSLVAKTRAALDEYQANNPDFKQLNFQYINLKSVQSDGEKNFFLALNSALKAIDSRLGITNIQRTPDTLNEGFYNKNTELLSFYWSPDYNGVGTWLKYMFSNTFSMANFWPCVYMAIQNNTQSWSASLKQELQKYTFDGKQSILLNHPELVAWVNSSENTTKMSIDDAYVVIANVIGKWVKDNSGVDVYYTGDGDLQTVEHDAKLIRYENLGLGIDFVNFIASNPANIPFVEDGPWTDVPWLVRNGFYNQANPNTDYSYRDWFYDSSITSNSRMRHWVSSSPFASNQTPFNSSFAAATSSNFFQSCWVALTSWTTIGDENSNALPYEGSFLVSNGTSTPVDELKAQFENSNQTSITFKIRPLPWVDRFGRQVQYDNGKLAFLSPQDYLASIKSFLRSTSCNLNSNGYFLSLLGLNIEQTLNDPLNNERNLSPDDEKEFTLYFDNPTLSVSDILDIFQKQYFCAQPAFKQTVKNIIDDDLWKQHAVLTSSGSLNTTATDMSAFYGSGDWRKSWNDWVYVGPYYISNITEQNIVFNINQSYFDGFVNETGDEYTSFKLQYQTADNKVVKKFNTVDLKYAGSYSDNILFEQFKANELDISPILSANLVDVYNSFRNDLYYVSSKKINRSDIVGYNLQIYEKDNNDLIIDNATGDGMGENGVPSYTVDEWGNFDFQGKTPRLKSRVSKEYADLIVKDFFTPIEAGGVSQLIRTTINTAINWVSLQTLVFPGVTKSIQYSFMPFGVFELDAVKHEEVVSLKSNEDAEPFLTSSVENFTKYWFLVSSKRYMTDDELINLTDETIKLRQSGSIIWTYDELLDAMIK